MVPVVVDAVSVVALLAGVGGVIFGLLLKVLASDAKHTATVRSVGSYEREREEER